MTPPSSYRPSREIARGGMGAVLDARDQKLGRSVAMKVMLRSDASNAEKQRFLQEARVLGQLAHPNIVPIHDLGTDSLGRLFYTMKLVQGVTLQDILQKLKDGDTETLAKYPLNQLLTVFHKVCDGVAFSHSRGILHRDLKPSNIMVGEFGEVLVMDWGLAKILPGSQAWEQVERPAMPITEMPTVAAAPGETLPRGRHDDMTTLNVPVSIGATGISDDLPNKPPTSQLTMEGEVLGTPNYMAPEQASGQSSKVDERSDVYALGGILYAVLTLRPPVDGENMTEVLSKVCSGAFAAPVALSNPESTIQASAGSGASPRPSFIPLLHCPGGQVPEALSAVTMKALRFERERRYQSVAEMAKDIEAYQNGFATTAEEASALTLVRLFIKRNKTLAIAVLVVLTLSAAFTSKVVSEGRRAERALLDLRRTAPIMAREAERLVLHEEFDEALHTLSSALSLDPGNTEYLLSRGRILMGMQRLDEAAAAFRQALARGANVATTEQNLRLCEKILRNHPAGQPLSTESRIELENALIEQGHILEAVPLSKLLGREMQTAKAAITNRLSSLNAVTGFSWDRLEKLGNNAFRLNLDGLPIVTAPPLGDLPITHLYADGSKLTDLRPLHGSRLKWLFLNNTPVRSLEGLQGLQLEELHLFQSGITNLGPLRGLPLKKLAACGIKIADVAPLTACRSIEHLEIHSTPVADLAPLRGLPLKNLHLNLTRITDLTPLHGMPLNELDISDTPVADIAVLRSMPLQRLNLHGCGVIKDFSPLADCAQLEAVHLPKRNTDWSLLRNLPRLQRLSDEDKVFSFDNLPYAQTFWQLHDSRLGITKPPRPPTRQ
ncbi:MAG: protein kinase [Verrucomicrobia bacterium]|nr:protein kinase [Verrucomicrobiota bacterium]